MKVFIVTNDLGEFVAVFSSYKKAAQEVRNIIQCEYCCDASSIQIIHQNGNNWKAWYEGGTLQIYECEIDQSSIV